MRMARRKVLSWSDVLLLHAAGLLDNDDGSLLLLLIFLLQYSRPQCHVLNIAGVHFCIGLAHNSSSREAERGGAE